MPLLTPRRYLGWLGDARPLSFLYRNEGALPVAPPGIDQCLLPLTSVNRGMVRILAKDVLRLRVGDKVTPVIPPSDHCKDDIVNKQRSEILSRFKRILLPDTPWMTAAEEKQYIDEVMKACTIVREGQGYYEFNLVVTCYPEHHKLEDRGLRKATLDSLLHPSTGVDIYVELRGYGSCGKTNFKLLSIPYFELYVQLPSDGNCLNRGIKFNKKCRMTSSQLTWCTILRIRGGHCCLRQSTHEVLP